MYKVCEQHQQTNSNISCWKGFFCVTRQNTATTIFIFTFRKQFCDFTQQATFGQLNTFRITGKFKKNTHTYIYARRRDCDGSSTPIQAQPVVASYTHRTCRTRTQTCKSNLHSRLCAPRTIIVRNSVPNKQPNFNLPTNKSKPTVDCCYNTLSAVCYSNWTIAIKTKHMHQ